MPFSQLTDRLGEVFRRLRGRGTLSEKDVDEAIRQIRMALLEADVNFRVAKDIVSRVRERAVGREILAGVAPAHQVVKIVQDELATVMGGGHSGLAFASRPPTTYMLVGLHGAGKTTAAAKLAAYLRSQGHGPLLVAADLRRPAAQEQLATLGAAHGLPTWTGPQNLVRPSPAAPETVAATMEVARSGLLEARKNGCDVVIMDTGGRLQIDDELMGELEELRRVVVPTEILLVVDAMAGQDAVNVAEVFGRRIGLDGVILTKLDGDARGGAALSIRAVTGTPVKFAGTGEKISDFEPFHPDRLASRILGMGDLVSLVERAESALDAEKALQLQRRLARDEFTLEDFLEQLRQVRRMGSIQDLIGLLPGGAKMKALGDPQVSETELGRAAAIILSMTRQERRDPSIIDGSRRRRIAAGSGTSTSDVNRLLRQYAETKKLVKRLSSKGRDLPGLGRFFKP